MFLVLEKALQQVQFFQKKRWNISLVRLHSTDHCTVCVELSKTLLIIRQIKYDSYHVFQSPSVISSVNYLCKAEHIL